MSDVRRVELKKDVNSHPAWPIITGVLKDIYNWPVVLSKIVQAYYISPKDLACLKCKLDEGDWVNMEEIEWTKFGLRLTCNCCYLHTVHSKELSKVQCDICGKQVRSDVVGLFVCYSCTVRCWNLKRPNRIPTHSEIEKALFLRELLLRQRELGLDICQICREKGKHIYVSCYNIFEETISDIKN
jgi:hypothetical protein